MNIEGVRHTVPGQPRGILKSSSSSRPISRTQKGNQRPSTDGVVAKEALSHLGTDKAVRFDVNSTCKLFNRHEPANKIKDETLLLIATKDDRDISTKESNRRIPPQKVYTLARLVQEGKEGYAITESQLSEAYRSAFSHLIDYMFPLIKGSKEAKKIQETINETAEKLLCVAVDKTIDTAVEGMEQIKVSGNFDLAPDIFKHLLDTYLTTTIDLDEEALTLDDMHPSHILEQNDAVNKEIMGEVKERCAIFHASKRFKLFSHDSTHVQALKLFFEQFK